MDPIMRFVLTIIGGYIGGKFGSAGGRFFDCLIGAAVGFVIADSGVLRSRVDALTQEVSRLRTQAHAAAAAAAAASAAVHRSTAPPEPTPVPVPPAATATPAATPTPTPTPTPAPSPAPTPTVRPAMPAAAPPRAADPITVRPWRELEPETRRAAPPAPAAAPRPRAIARDEPPSSPIIDAVRGFFTGGNTLVRVGVIILLFGVGFLLRYMAEHTHLPIELRLSGVVLAGIALLVFGWRLRHARPGYALAVQGGAVGILYLTVFAAMRLYQVLPVPLAFFVLVALAVCSAVLAVLQNSLSFALLGVTGGFLAPVLASTGAGSHVVLFSYYAVLNAGILAIAWFKAWRPLNLAGFVFTFAIGTAWGVLKYRPEDFATTEPFLVLFFLFYLGISVLFTLRQPPNLKGYVDGTLVFGTPLIAFGLQSALLRGRLLELAYSSLAVSALYLALAGLLKRRGDNQRVLFEAFLALGVVFLTLAVPLALDVRWNSITWALEGAALIWVGCRQSRVLPRVFGSLLIAAAGCLAATRFQYHGSGFVLPIEDYYGVLALGAAAVFAARTLAKFREGLTDLEQFLPPGLFLWGLLFWLAGGLAEISAHAPPYVSAAALGFLALTALILCEARGWLALRAAEVATLFLLPAMACFAADTAIDGGHPFAALGWIAWPLSFAVWYRILYRGEGAARSSTANVFETASAWLLCWVSSWEFAWTVNHEIQGSETWAAIAWAAIPALVLFALPKLVTRVAWPFGKHRELYLFVVAAGIALYLGLWSLFTNLTLTGGAEPLPYVPLLNPLDIAQGLVFAVLARYWLFLRPVPRAGLPRIDPRVPLPALVALVFIWLNGVLLRTLHQWFWVPFTVSAMIDSTLVETSLSIFWAFLALATMLYSARKRHRAAWLAGAALISVVIAKLFFVDLSHSSSIDRIVSFVGVGLLMLVVGYFSPIPPPREEAA